MWRSEDLSTLLAFLFHPLVLVGVLLLAAFGLSQNIDAGIFTAPRSGAGSRILHHGFGSALRSWFWASGFSSTSSSSAGPS